MDTLEILQQFFVAWMDELWWSMRDRVGALSMIECFANSWKAGGSTIGNHTKNEGQNIVESIHSAHKMLGRTTDVTKNTILVSSCPFWNRIKKTGLEYALHCEEFLCAPLLEGIREALNANETQVETSLRLAYITRARLEYKISKLESTTLTSSDTKDQLAKLKKELAALPKTPVCIFHAK
jgi:hypothetical protein